MAAQQSLGEETISVTKSPVARTLRGTLEHQVNRLLALREARISGETPAWMA